MSSDLPSDLVGNSFRDGRFPPLPGNHLRRSDVDGPMNPRFGEHMPPTQIHNQIGNDDGYWGDGPGHLTRGKPSGPGYLPGTFSGHGYAGEDSGNFPRPPFSGPFGDHAMRNNYPFHGLPNAGKFSVSFNITWFFFVHVVFYLFQNLLFELLIWLMFMLYGMLFV